MFLPYKNRRAKITALLVLSCIVVLPSVSDSLWDEGAPGLLAGSASLQTGDTILVNIDINQDLSYDSSRIDSERVSIELSGGDGGGLFSFLPSGASSGNQSLTGSESLAFQTLFAVSVIGVDQTGRLILRGGRTVVIQGKQASITLTGTADPALIGENRSLPFSSIVDARIVYETLLTTGAPTLRAGDVEQVPVAPAAGVGPAAAGGPATGPAAGVASAAANATTGTATGTQTGAGTAAAGTGSPVITQPTLTDEKKQELLLLYLNRLIDLVFEQ